jgi:hypothetical protein
VDAGPGAELPGNRCPPRVRGTFAGRQARGGWRRRPAPRGGAGRRRQRAALDAARRPARRARRCARAPERHGGERPGASSEPRPGQSRAGRHWWTVPNPAQTWPSLRAPGQRRPPARAPRRSSQTTSARMPRRRCGVCAALLRLPPGAASRNGRHAWVAASPQCPQPWAYPLQRHPPFRHVAPPSAREPRTRRGAPGRAGAGAATQRPAPRRKPGAPRRGGSRREAPWRVAARPRGVGSADRCCRHVGRRRGRVRSR